MNNLTYKSEEQMAQTLKEIAEVNAPFIEKRKKAYLDLISECPLPVVGEFIQIGDKITRTTSSWNEGIQVGGSANSGGYHMYSNAACSYSGGLDPAIPYDKLELVKGKFIEGKCWYFDRECTAANNAFYFWMPFRVFKYTGKLEDVYVR